MDEDDGPDSLDLSPELPGPRADPVIEPRITSETSFKAPWGFELSTKSDGPAHGPAGLALAVLILSIAGALGALVVGSIAAFVGTPALITVVIGGLVFFSALGAGLLMIFRIARRGG